MATVSDKLKGWEVGKCGEHPDLDLIDSWPPTFSLPVAHRVSEHSALFLYMEFGWLWINMQVPSQLILFDIGYRQSRPLPFRNLFSFYRALVKPDRWSLVAPRWPLGFKVEGDIS